MKPLLKTLVTGSVMVLVSHLNISAATITTTEDALTTTNNVVVGESSTASGVTGQDVDGFYFYGGDGSGNSALAATAVPGYATAALTSATTGGASQTNYTTITEGSSAPGSSIQTGIDYNNAEFGLDRSSDNPTVYYAVATIDLNGTVPSNFNLSILNGNTNTAENNPLYAVTLDSGAATLTPAQAATAGATLLNSSHDPANDSNDFYNLNVSGATSTDYLTIYAGNDPAFYMSGNSSANYQNVLGIGGVVFSSIPVMTPEPSTYALMFAGLGILLAVQRFNRRNA